jgi:hypothetical protein
MIVEGGVIIAGPSLMLTLRPTTTCAWAVVESARNVVTIANRTNVPKFGVLGVRRILMPPFTVDLNARVTKQCDKRPVDPGEGSV